MHKTDSQPTSMTFHVSLPPALQPPPCPLPVRSISYMASAAWVRLAPCAMRFTTTYLFQSHSGGRWKSCGIGSYWWSSTKAIRQQWDQRNQPWRGFETFGSSRLSESNLNMLWTCPAFFSMITEHPMLPVKPDPQPCGSVWASSIRRCCTKQSLVTCIYTHRPL